MFATYASYVHQYYDNISLCDPPLKHLTVFGTAALIKDLEALNITDGKVDLSDCRLHNDCLPHLLDWMEWRGDHVAAKLPRRHRRHVSVRVGGSGISIFELCRALTSKMGHVEWISTARVSVRDGEQGRELDKVHAEGYMQGRAVSMDEALSRVGKHLEKAASITEETAKRQDRSTEEATHSAAESAKEHKTLRQEIKQLHDSANKFEKGTKSVRLHAHSACKALSGEAAQRSWFKSHTDSYEVLVTQLTRMYLSRAYSIGHTSDVFELERSRHSIPKMPPVYEQGVEWDGVLYVPEARHLFLVEAKSALEKEHIDSMRDRMDRTVQFIKLCHNGDLPLTRTNTHPKYETIELCGSWGRFASACKVFGVIGGIGFTQSMLDAADKHGLLRVVPNDGVYDILMPSLQRLISVTPPAPAPAREAEAPAFVSKQFTEQEVEDDAEAMFDNIQDEQDCT